MAGRDDILCGNTERLEKRDSVVRRSSLNLPDQDLSDLAKYVAVIYGAFVLRDQEVSRFIECRLSPVHVHLCLCHRAGVELAHLWR